MEQAFRKEMDRALSDANLSGALGRFSVDYKKNWRMVYADVDFEALRTRIAGIKSDAASRIGELSELFKKNAEARGAKVFCTNDPEEAKRYILEVARDNGVKKVVKSKSMATEEIHLNAFLEREGLEVAETDLGERIIQLAGQRPSHMVMPAIHLTKENVADIFSKAEHRRIEADIQTLTQEARTRLRAAFLDADMGISGANIAVAETGSLVLVTNEGNARLVTSLPPIHIALVGVEKLIEHLADIAPILKALPRSGTNQLLTSYVTLITGQTPNTDGSAKNLHIILLDNHRSEMAVDPVFKEAMQCIRCASCCNVCPIFRLVGGHVFGKVYTGGIGAILTAWSEQLKSSEEIQALCIQCGACKDVCPAKIDIPGLILEIRRRLVQKDDMPKLQKAIFAVVNNRRLFHGMLRAASVASKPLAKGGKFIRHLPMFLANLTDGRSLPAIAAKPLRDTIGGIAQPKGLAEKAVFYAGCLIDFVYPEMGEDLVRILNRAGIEVVFPENQTCCGAPARYSGAYEVAAKNAVDNIEALLSVEADYVISACPTCTAALAHEFIATLESTGQRHHLTRARGLAAKVTDFSTLVKKLIEDGRLTLKEGRRLGAITYHDSCHLKRTLHAEQAPRELLTKAGYELKELFECDVCCGMGGSYSVKLPEMSAPLLQRKLQNIKESGAPVVAMDCPGCVMQIRGGMDQDGAAVEVRHTVELLAQQLAD